MKHGFPSLSLSLSLSLMRAKNLKYLAQDEHRLYAERKRKEDTETLD